MAPPFRVTGDEPLYINAKGASTMTEKKGTPGDESLYLFTVTLVAVLTEYTAIASETKPQSQSTYIGTYQAATAARTEYLYDVTCEEGELNVISDLVEVPAGVLDRAIVAKVHASPDKAVLAWSRPL